MLSICLKRKNILVSVNKIVHSLIKNIKFQKYEFVSICTFDSFKNNLNLRKYKHAFSLNTDDVNKPLYVLIKRIKVI